MDDRLTVKGVVEMSESEVLTRKQILMAFGIEPYTEAVKEADLVQQTLTPHPQLITVAESLKEPVKTIVPVETVLRINKKGQTYLDKKPDELQPGWWLVEKYGKTYLLDPDQAKEYRCIEKARSVRKKRIKSTSKNKRQAAKASKRKNR